MTLTVGREAHRAAVHADHEAALLHWHSRAVADAPRFVLVVAFLPLLMLAMIGLMALISRSIVFPTLGLILIAVAAFIWTHPYATPQTARLIGVQRSIRVVRALAVALGLGGTGALLVGIAMILRQA